MLFYIVWLLSTDGGVSCYSSDVFSKKLNILPSSVIPAETKSKNKQTNTVESILPNEVLKIKASDGDITGEMTVKLCVFFFFYKILLI